MKKLPYIIISLMAMLLLGSCRKDLTIRDMSPVPERAEGAGYVTGFDTPQACIYIPVEVPTAGQYTITVRGRATQDGTVGTGEISVGTDNASISFDKAYVWSDCTVNLSLQAGVNDICISAGDGNGLFQTDYIDLK